MLRGTDRGGQEGAPTEGLHLSFILIQVVDPRVCVCKTSSSCILEISALKIKLCFNFKSWTYIWLKKSLFNVKEFFQQVQHESPT